MRTILALAVLTALSACSTSGQYQAKPISTGAGPNALKRTPCACVELKNQAGLPAYLNVRADAA